MAKVYLETSMISALVTDRPDVASMYRRKASHEWWSSQAAKHDLFISAEVIAELSHTGYAQSQTALDLTRDLALLPITDEVQGLARILVSERVMPSPVAGDAIHLAVAAAHRMEYLLTWNVRHLANPNKLKHLRVVCLRAGIVPPQIVTPDLLWEYEDESG